MPHRSPQIRTLLLLLVGSLSVLGCDEGRQVVFQGTSIDLLKRFPDTVLQQEGVLEPSPERQWGDAGLAGWYQVTETTPEGLAYVETNQPLAVLNLSALGPEDRTIRMILWCEGPADGPVPRANLRLNGIAETTVELSREPNAVVTYEVQAPAWQAGENLLEIEVPTSGAAGTWNTLQLARVSYDEACHAEIDGDGSATLPPGTGMEYVLETRSDAQLHITGTSKGRGWMRLAFERVDAQTGERLDTLGKGTLALEDLERGERYDLPRVTDGRLRVRLTWQPRGDAPIVLEKLAVVETEQEPRPAIVFISIDTLSARNLSLYGYPRKTTPALDHLAEESVVFERCLTNAPWTMPSYLSVMTGLYPRAHELDLQRPQGVQLAGWDNWQIAESRWTLAEMLRAIGYETAAYVDTHWLLDKFRVDQGFDLYDTRAAEISLADPTGGIAAIQSIGVPEFLTGLERGAPFFLFVHALDAHGPYIPGEIWRGRFEEEPPEDGWEPVPAGSEFQTYRAIPEWMARTSVLEGPIPEHLPLEPIVERYDEAILKTDHYIGELLADLDERGLYDDAVIVISADHGESFEHEFYSHGGMWEPIVHVPLIVRLPKGEYGGTRVRSTVQLVDLYPTLLELVGLPHRGKGLHGHSLLPLVRGEEVEERVAFSEEGHCEQYQLSLGPWKLVVEYPGRKSAPQSILTHPRVPEEWLRAHFPEILDGPLTPELFRTLRKREGFADRVAELRSLLDGPFISLYDIEADPGELDDRADAEPDKVAELLELLEQEKERSNEARSKARATPVLRSFAPDQLEELRALGYVGDEDEAESGK